MKWQKQGQLKQNKKWKDFMLCLVENQIVHILVCLVSFYWFSHDMTRVSLSKRHETYTSNHSEIYNWEWIWRPPAGQAILLLPLGGNSIQCLEQPNVHSNVVYEWTSYWIQTMFWSAHFLSVCHLSVLNILFLRNLYTISFCFY